MAKMSGRGLGHTGGTIDKMESIPNLKVSLEQDDFINQVNKIGLAVIGQSEGLAPADTSFHSWQPPKCLSVSEKDSAIRPSRDVNRCMNEGFYWRNNQVGSL